MHKPVSFRISILSLAVFLMLTGRSSGLLASQGHQSPVATPATQPSKEIGKESILQTALEANGDVSSGSVKADMSSDRDESEAGSEQEVKIADPLEPFNRAMFQFNDRLYFWVLKPVAVQYSKVVPEKGRAGIRNFFDNLKFPIRFVNNLLQANFKGAASELGRFTVNTFWGVGGLLDPASQKGLEIPPYDTDLGLTLGHYGVGQGFYIVWPVLGPSTARDTADILGEYYLDPTSYVDLLYASLGIKAYNIVNRTSLRIGDYESIKEAAIDPYISLRSGYIQYREQKIKQSSSKNTPNKPGGVF